MKPFERILVPVDFSEHSKEALRTAVGMARLNEGSITLVHVYEPAVYALPDGNILLTPAQFERLIRELEQYLEASKQEAMKLGAASVDSHLLQVFAAGEIVAYAKAANSDLIVMGTHGRTGPKHLLLGSVAERVIRAAHCPVLTIKAHPAMKG
jgi:universal stress protein A